MSSELIWCETNFSSKLPTNILPQNGPFGFLPLIKNYAETTLYIDEEYISQKAYYTAQQSSRSVISPKTCKRENTFA